MEKTEMTKEMRELLFTASVDGAVIAAFASITDAKKFADIAPCEIRSRGDGYIYYTSLEQIEFTHNGWLIEEGQDGMFTCTHPDFEGPYDDRLIVANSPEEAVRLIDEWVEPDEGYGMPDDYWRESHHAIQNGFGQ